MTDTLLEQYNQMQTALGHGCSDGYCVIEKTKGMHTNGGCMCLENMNFQDRQRVGHILRIAQKMEARILRDAETIKAAEALARLLKDEADCYDSTDTGAEEMYEALAAFRAAQEKNDEPHA